MIILDIGACEGGFIDFSLNRHHVEMIYGFEPLKVNYDFLTKKYENNSKVSIFPGAVSGYEGVGKLFKKHCGQNKGCNSVGNSGCSLNSQKKNVSVGVYEEVEVIKISSFLMGKKCNKIDIIKIDAEGSEYEIFLDILDNKIYEIIDKIYYEDHSNKIIGDKKYLRDKESFISKIIALNIGNKIWLQSEENVYDVPFLSRHQGKQ